MVRLWSSLAVVACVVGACGGKIEQSADNSQSAGAGPLGSGSTTNPIGPTQRAPSSPQTAPTTSPVAPGSSGNAGTYVNGPLGFVVRDAFSFSSGPSQARELHGIWMTSFTNACERQNATTGASVLRIDFSDDSGPVTPGTYPLEGPAPSDQRTAYAQVWVVTAAGCSAEGDPGAHFESGSVTIEKSTENGIVGSFHGVLIDNDGNEGTIDGHFDAPRCPSGSNSCTPP